MPGRLFKLFVLIAVGYALARWLLSSRQKAALGEGARTLAQALLLSALLTFLWQLFAGAR
ncbi:protein MIGRI [Crenobacter luteus]|uniref:Uncharacterized protein n=1 Tax=Crenobacter luteus TaxID=1452487 RepID=A0A163CYX6_9NEIS|nr:hypothetical protein [Crenobacter luteus]KZE33507.1 hypothetical protein AVW16_08180 [Crenobacter luteus]